MADGRGVTDGPLAGAGQAEGCGDGRRGRADAEAWHGDGLGACGRRRLAQRWPWSARTPEHGAKMALVGADIGAWREDDLGARGHRSLAWRRPGSMRMPKHGTKMDWERVDGHGPDLTWRRRRAGRGAHGCRSRPRAGSGAEQDRPKGAETVDGGARMLEPGAETALEHADAGSWREDGRRGRVEARAYCGDGRGSMRS